MDLGMSLSDFKEACQYHMPEKETSDELKYNYLFESDIDVCNYVSGVLPCVLNSGKADKRISAEELIVKSLEEFKNFDEKNYSNLCNLINSVQFLRGNDKHNFVTRTAYCTNIVDGREIDEIITYQYIIPGKLYDVDIFSLVHEHCHALKETNYLEIKNNLIFSEVIPIFYELFTFDPNISAKVILLEQRLQHLWNNKDSYLMTNELMKGELGYTFIKYDEEEFYQRSIYEYVRSYIGCYLNSFYYAVILYNMYKINPEKILSYISRVLSHELTTYDMLVQLGIYGDIKGELFEKELDGIKRSLKIK